MTSTTTNQPDFIVIQPSSDIINRLEYPDFREIESDVENYLDISHKVLSQCPDTQLFITSLPPRYDREEASKATDLWNSILVTKAFVHDRVHVVAQSGLECKQGRQRFERYKEDGFLLSKYGTKLLSKNIVTSVTEVLNNVKGKQGGDVVKTLRVKKQGRRKQNSLKYIQYGV